MRPNRRPNFNPPRTNYPVRPTNTATGLSSAVNRNCVLQIFAASTREEVEAVLRQADYRPGSSGGRNSTPVDLGAALAGEVQVYLKSEHGLRHLARERDEAVRRQAQNWLGSREGQEQLRGIKARLLAAEVGKDVELFERTCREEVGRRVDRWLKSPVGLETIEDCKRRAIEQQVTQNAAPAAPTWIDRQLQQIEGAGGIRPHG